MTVLEWLEFARDKHRSAGPTRFQGDLNAGFTEQVAREVWRTARGVEFPDAYRAVENVIAGKRTPAEAARELGQ